MSTSWRYNLTDYFGSTNGSRGLRVSRVGDISDPGGGGVVEHAPGEETGEVAPAIGATVFTDDPYRAGSLIITRNSDAHVYTSGVDYEEVAPRQWTNLAIVAGTPITVSYIIDVRYAYAGITRAEADTLYQILLEKDQPDGYVGLNSLGTIDPERLATGTPEPGTYPDGSGEWLPLPTGSSGGGGFPRECILSTESITIEECEQMPVYKEIRVAGALRIEGTLVIYE